MQANNDPKWTDDAAFWNEAWADMDKRLDQKPPSRKAVVVWWRRYGWLLGLALLITAVATPAAIAYLQQSGETEQQEIISPESPTNPASTPPVFAEEERTPAIQESKVSPTAPGEANNNTINSAVTAEGLTNPVAAIVPTPATKQTLSSTSPIKQEVIAADEAPTGLTTPILNVPTSSDIPGHNVAASPALEKGIPAALTPLADQPIGAIKFAQTYSSDQLEVVINKPKFASRLYLDAGTSYGLKGNNLGYYAGLQYSLPISKRFSVPIGIRVRRDFHQFVELAESGTPARFLETPNSNGSATPDTITFEFTAENLKEIVTTSFEGRIGMSYAATPRLRIGASLSINYLQSAIARISSQYQTEFAFDQSSRFFYADADITLVSGANFNRSGASIVSQGTPLILGNNSESNFPQFNQLVTTGALNLSYDLTNKLSLTLAGRRLLGQPDQSKAIGLQRGQLEVGALWRLQ